MRDWLQKTGYEWIIVVFHFLLGLYTPFNAAPVFSYWGSSGSLREPNLESKANIKLKRQLHQVEDHNLRLTSFFFFMLETDYFVGQSWTVF